MPRTARRPTRPRTARGTLGARVLLASDGHESADAAVAFARALASRDQGAVHVLGVVEPVPAFVAGSAELPVPDVEPFRREATSLAIRAQVERVVDGAQWDSLTTSGMVADEVAREARRLRATVVILGLGRHRRVDRILGETAVRVARAVPVPMLAVAPPFRGLPRTAVAAVDFSPSSVAAAQLACSLVGQGGSVVLAHVRPFPMPSPRDDRVGWAELYTEGAAQRLDELAARLATLGPRVTRAVLEGEPSAAILAIAARTHADVIAAGAHAQGAIERLFVGSTTTRLLRGATTTVLIAPAV